MAAIRFLLYRLHPLLAKIYPSSYRPYRFAGGILYVDITESPMMLARVLGAFEVEKHKAVKTFLKPGSAFIDVGANKGDFALLAAKISGGSGKVLAFEPESTNCHWISESIAANHYSNISLYEMALSDEDGEAALFLGKKSGWHTLLPGQPARDQGVVNVKVRRLDSLLEEQHFTAPIGVIKIDVEGAEMRVLQGASKTLDANPQVVLLIDLHPQLSVDQKQVCDFLRQKGFSIFHEDASFSKPVTEYKNLTAIVARRSSGNS